jgi:hypothetical protein
MGTVRNPKAELKVNPETGGIIAQDIPCPACGGTERSVMLDDHNEESR